MRKYLAIAAVGSAILYTVLCGMFDTVQSASRNAAAQAEAEIASINP